MMTLTRIGLLLWAVGLWAVAPAGPVSYWAGVGFAGAVVFAIWPYAKDAL